MPTDNNNTNWQARALLRYVFPYEIGVASNIRHLSGFPWAPIHRVSVPGSGTQPIFLENIENNRSDNVTIVDLRLDKTFVIGRRHRVTGMFDVYNLLNGNPVTNFSLRTGSSFGRVIAALEARTVMLKIRWQF